MRYHGKEYLLYMQVCKKYGVYPEAFHCNPEALGTEPSELRFAWLHVQAELFDPSVYWFSNEEIQREMLLAMLQDECQEAFTFYRKMLDSLLDLDDTVVSQVICEFLIPYITETVPLMIFPILIAPKFFLVGQSNLVRVVLFGIHKKIHAV